jgi:hypothetical protein
MNDTLESLNHAGDVIIEEIFLFSSNGLYVDLRNFFREISIYESIFSPVMTGSILIGDNRNLIKYLTITGDEHLTVKVKTPGLKSELTISKTFRVYSISDRRIIDQSTQLYVLNFISIEGFVSNLVPIRKAFSGRVSEIVAEIFDNYFTNTRYITTDGQNIENLGKSQLNILDETENSIKFVSPGWSPTKCFQWLCSKAIPKSGKACNYLFFEGNKFFYFTPVETIFNLGVNVSIGMYRYFPPGVFETTDSEKKLFQIQSVRMLTALNNLENITNGYYGSRVIDLNIMDKDYSYVDYYYPDKFNEYTHSAGSSNEGANPLFLNGAAVAPQNNFKLNFVHPGLHTDVQDNFTEKVSEIYGNRVSNILNLSNYNLEIVVPGRTDVEVGSLMYIDLPDTGPLDESDKSADNFDPLSSGNYLITKIHHKINALPRHSMIMEVAKDSFSYTTDVY